MNDLKAQHRTQLFCSGHTIIPTCSWRVGFFIFSHCSEKVNTLQQGWSHLGSLVSVPQWYLNFWEKNCKNHKVIWPELWHGLNLFQVSFHRLILQSELRYLLGSCRQQHLSFSFSAHPFVSWEIAPEFMNSLTANCSLVCITQTFPCTAGRSFWGIWKRRSRELSNLKKN